MDFRKVTSYAALALIVAVAHAASLADVCTPSHVRQALPAAGFLDGATIDHTSVRATPTYNVSIAEMVMFPDDVIDYCAVKFAYSHDGLSDRVSVTYWLPSPDNFENRFLSTGGGGYLISSGDSPMGSLPGGIIYGAVAGTTDGGFGSLTTQFNEVYLLANGSPSYQNLHMFGYKAIHEMTVLGKELTRQYYGMNSTKLYSYYQGCSEGGREGWSQIQRYADQWDGAVVGAPAFRFSFQQVQHAYSDIVEQTVGYVPPPCELQKIVNETIKHCDALDGKVDGVLARSDLCKLKFNISSLVGTAYSCEASPEYDGFPSHPYWPAQNGTISEKGVKVAQVILDGLHDSNGNQVYLSYQPGSTFVDAYPQYDNQSDAFVVWPSDFAAAFVLPFLEYINSTSFETLEGVTYDILKDWINQGWQTYEDTLHTTWPDLTPFSEAGGKILHYHGESDFSIPTGSSVHYRESVRSIMYPNMSYNASNEKLNEWYRLYLVPGAGHCSTNPYQPNGPFPQTNLAVLIDWVEKGTVPETLNATHLAGENIGNNAQICTWPLRPIYASNGSLECQYDQASINSWQYNFEAFKLPVY